MSADFSFEGLTLLEENTSKLAQLLPEQPLSGARCHLDTALGIISVQGASSPFKTGFTFSALTIRIKYPFGVIASGLVMYNMRARSTVAVRYRVDAATHAGESSSFEPFVLVQDSEPPRFATCPSSLNVTALNTSSVGKVTWEPPVVVDNRPQGIRTSLSLRYGTETIPFTSTATSASFPVRSPQDPVATLTYTSRDEYGNTAQCQFSVRVIDADPPGVQCQRAINTTLLEGDAVTTVPFSAWQPATVDNSNLTVTVLQPTVTDLILSVGTHVIYTLVADAWNNTAECYTTILVRDLEPPSIRCPSDSTFASDGQGTTLVLQAPEVNDNTGADQVQWTSSHENGQRLSAGAHNISYKATDGSGNTATCVTALQVQASLASTSDSTATTAVGSGAGVLVLIVAALGILVRRQIKRNRAPANWDEVFAMIEQFRNSDGDGPKLPRELNRRWLKLLEELGRGAFGLVYKGLLEVRSPAAIH